MQDFYAMSCFLRCDMKVPEFSNLGLQKFGFKAFLLLSDCLRETIGTSDSRKTFEVNIGLKPNFIGRTYTCTASSSYVSIHELFLFRKWGFLRVAGTLSLPLPFLEVSSRIPPRTVD